MIFKFDKFNESIYSLQEPESNEANLYHKSLDLRNSSSKNEFPKFEDLLYKSRSIKYKQDIIDIIDELSDSGLKYKVNSGHSMMSKSDCLPFEEGESKEDFVKFHWNKESKIVECLFVDLDMGDDDDDDDDNYDYDPYDEDEDEDDSDEEDDDIIDTYVSDKDLDASILGEDNKLVKIEKKFNNMKKKADDNKMFLTSLKRITKLDSEIRIYTVEYLSEYVILFA